ncbi:DUF2309 domain-containing protein, partial [Methylocucumis oryzae]
GYQELPFEEALDTAQSLTGVSGYLPEQKFRELFQQQRINEADLDAAFAFYPGLLAEQAVCQVYERTIYRRDVYKIALLQELSPLSFSGLLWQIHHNHALQRIQKGVPEFAQTLLLAGGSEAEAVRRLWDSVLIKLELETVALHPEALLDLTIEQAEDWLNQGLSAEPQTSFHIHTQQQAEQEVERLFAELGNSLSLRGLVLALSGLDILDCVRPQLIKVCASALDEGIAHWHNPEQELSLYKAWRMMLSFDANLFLHQLPDWQTIIADLPEEPLDAIIIQLTKMALPEAQWEGYLRRIALEIPGWSGFINWRQHHPKYNPRQTGAITLADYLAIRLVLDRLWLNQACHDLWQVDANVQSLTTYFRKNLSEFFVRKHLYQGRLPEYLSQEAHALIIRAGSERQAREQWQQLADKILTWQLSPNAATAEPSVENSAWRIFLLCQHLGLNAKHVLALNKTDCQQLLALLNEFDSSEHSKVWLYAYEFHYREQLLQGLRANYGYGAWAKRDTRPEAQLIFCMDEREEAFRRHLEEHNPALETLGAAGFFGIAMDYQGLTDTKPSALCPIVVTPQHSVRERTHPEVASKLIKHQQGFKRLQALSRLFNYRSSSEVLTSVIAIPLMAPVLLAHLLGIVLMPELSHRLMQSLKRVLKPGIKTYLQVNLTANEPEVQKPGFSDSEQAERVTAFLRSTGLSYGFAELIVLIGHGSTSQNNPHDAAHNCGACSGKHGGPNARAFAIMANRAEVRELLQQRGINIPSDTWFIAAEHNTCSEDIKWYDLEDIPPARLIAFERLQQQLNHARQMSAHERCRRFASAPKQPKPKRALSHIYQRSIDFTQSRPELGHATNAAAIIGRRSLSRGLFLDRRVFLISYDPTQDPDGKILEGILLAVSPVGAGINLEYYFSTINNTYFGCGTKTPHNIMGMVAVMEGTNSDLLTGLPLQMVEVHEAMRLQVIVEATPEILTAIYQRQPSLRELIGGAWLHLTAIHPETGAMSLFNPDAGFEPWQSQPVELPVCTESAACYQGQTEPVAPHLIRHQLK